MESLGDILRGMQAKVLSRGYDEPGPEAPRCGICKGAGIITLNRHYGDPDFAKDFPCDCQFNDLGESLDDFEVNPYDHKYPDLALALEATRHWLDSRGPGLLVLGGPRGVGKSHLMLAATHALMRLREIHWSGTDKQLDTTIRGSFDRNTTTSVLQMFASTPWLLIDDYGTIARRDTMEGLIDDLFNQRWVRHEECKTMITTNIGSEDMTARIRSRFNDKSRSRYLIIDAPDYRLKRR